MFHRSEVPMTLVKVYKGSRPGSLLVAPFGGPMNPGLKLLKLAPDNEMRVCRWLAETIVVKLKSKISRWQAKIIAPYRIRKLNDQIVIPTGLSRWD